MRPRTISINVNKKILADVGRGIYRSPANAMKELVSNAFDACATWVKITTNAPYFDIFTCEDNRNQKEDACESGNRSIHNVVLFRLTILDERRQLGTQLDHLCLRNNLEPDPCLTQLFEFRHSMPGQQPLG